MKLENDLAVLKLDVVGYQFPELNDNWLNVRLHLKVGLHKWERIDPALETGDLRQISNWLGEVVEHIAVFGRWRTQRLSTRLNFTEPNLEFEIFNGHPSDAPATFRVHLSHEFLQPFRNLLSHAHLDDDPTQLWLDFGVTGEKLQELTDSLQVQLDLYPSRH